MEMYPASMPMQVTKSATLPLDSFSITADKKSGTPDFPKYPDIIHILSKMAMTFQSTILKASMSVMTPKKIMKRIPNNAANTLSIQPVMTRIMLARKMMVAAHSMYPMIVPPYENLLAPYETVRAGKIPPLLY